MMSDLDLMQIVVGNRQEQLEFESGGKNENLG